MTRADPLPAAEIVECVPNFAEGRRPEVVAEIVAAAKAAGDVHVLDAELDANHHRSVVTFAGRIAEVEKAAFACVAKACERIDLTVHKGEHPRMGATDVLPFVPVRGTTMEACVALARRVGRRIGEELQIPVFFYEEAATRPERRNLADVRAPQYLKGGARRGPTWRETLLMHAVARLALHPLIPNIQVSWVKLGAAAASLCLQGGANDLGGTLMNESISRAAGNEHGEELPPARMDALIAGIGRKAGQRNTLYGPADPDQCSRSYDAPVLAPIVMTPLAGRPLPAGPQAAASRRTSPAPQL